MTFNATFYEHALLVGEYRADVYWRLLVKMRVSARCWWIAYGDRFSPRPGTGSLPRLAAANVHLHCSRMGARAGGSASLRHPAALTLHAAAQRGGADVVLGLLLLLLVVVGGGAVVVAARVVGTGSRHC